MRIFLLLLLLASGALLTGCVSPDDEYPVSPGWFDDDPR